MTTHAPPELESQYRAMREAAALVRPGRMGTLLVKGSEAVDFLQGQVTNDVGALEPGADCYALLLNPKGRILADMTVLMVAGDELLLVTDQPEIGKNLSMYTIGREAEVLPGEHAVAEVIGPAAESSFAAVELNGVSVLAVRTPLGIDVVYPADRPEVLDALADAVAATVTGEAADIARIEAGVPRYGVDMTADNLPGELGLEERAISFTKGCYVGQEPVARMHHRGHPNRHLRGIELTAPAQHGQELMRDGKQVGAITSASVSPALGPIALGLVRREIEPGQHVEAGDGVTGTVVELPFRRDG